MCLRCGFIPSAHAEDVTLEQVARWFARELQSDELMWEDQLPRALRLLRMLRGEEGE